MQPWANDAEFFRDFEELYIDGVPLRVLSCRIHKGNVIILFEGITNIDDAARLKNKTVYINRDEAELDPDEYFLQDVIGLDAVSQDDGKVLGKISDILFLPAGEVYVINGSREILVPAVPEFIKKIDMDSKQIFIHLIEGM